METRPHLHIEQCNIYDPYWQVTPSRIEYFRITQTGDSMQDDAKIQLAHILVRELARRKDTTYGVEFTFTAKAAYRNFVEALNVCTEEDARIYTVTDSSILVYWLNFRPSRKRGAWQPDYL